MGQSASAQRERDEFSRRDSRRFTQLIRERDARPESYGPIRNSGSGSEEQTPLSPRPRAYYREGFPSLQPFATLRRHISAQSIPLRGGPGGGSRGNTPHDEVLYEQEERLLVNVEDLRIPHAPITNITASPMPRRLSVISRLGNRILPRSSTTGSLIIERNTSGQRDTSQGYSSDAPLPRRNISRGNRITRRFSILGPLSPETSTSSGPSRRRRIAPISRPIPLMVDGTLPPSGLRTTPLRSSTPEQSSARGDEASNAASLRRSRLARVRRSISAPIESFFGTTLPQTTQDVQTQTPPRRPSRVAIADETDYLLPPLNVTDPNIDLDESGSGGFEPIDQRHVDVFSPVIESSPIWNQRWGDRTQTVRREARRVPNLLRGRSSRLIRRDDEAPLSRILQLAAAAIAAQLSGTPDAIMDMETVGDDGLDGSLNNFMETLNNAATTTINNTEANRSLTTLPPLNFLRVFRFVNAGTETRTNPATSTRAESDRATHGSESDGGDDGIDGRTVTLVVVGVRSVPSASINRDGVDGVEPNLDTLLSLPIVPLQTPLRNGAGGLLRNASGRSRFTHRRRASMGGVNPFPANYDSQRHQRMQGSSRSVSGDTTPVNVAPIPVVISESPPGPHPPPSTPAEPGLSALPSGATTPNRRPSSASAAHPPSSYYEHGSQRSQEISSTSAIEADATQNVRQRRRSDSEFARHRDLGAGAARRNGIVEPRSWLIYVVGTNLSEDHPAFATPSLFTDVSPLSSGKLISFGIHC